MKNPLFSDEATLRYYADKAPVYSASGKGGVNRFLASFVEQLPAGARILDLGCGGGRDSEEMLSRGFDVVPWDASEKIAAQAEQRLQRQVFVKRFDELNVICEFDAIWASASLLHVPLKTLPDILRLVHMALRPGGLHFASYKSGGQEGRDSVGRYFNFLSKAQLIDAYQQSGEWTILEAHEYIGGGYDNGERGPWIAVVASRH